MKKMNLTRWIATVGCILSALALAVFLILYSDRTVVSGPALTSAAERLLSPRTYGSYGELMFAYVGEGNRLYDLDDESSPLVDQAVSQLLYASDDSVLYVASCEISPEHPGRESVIQELQVGEKENRLNTIAITTIDPCWSGNDEVIYYVNDAAPSVLCTFEPLTSTSEDAAAFEEPITGLRISSDGLLVTLQDGKELLYVPLSKQLTAPGVDLQGQQITVCEQYDLVLSQAGELSYHWQGANELVAIAENVIAAISHQDNEIYYIQRAGTTRLMSFIVSEEQHNQLVELDDAILPQLSADTDYAFMLNEDGVVFRYDITSEQLQVFAFIDPEQVRAPLISLFDYRLMVYDLSAEPDITFRYALPAAVAFTEDQLLENREAMQELSAANGDRQQYSGLYALTMGASGEAVTQLQVRLSELGYLTTEATGFYGVQTMAAILQVQHELGLPETGYASRSLQSMLQGTAERPAPHALALGHSGCDVRALQARLLTLGWSNELPSGTMTEQTLSAVSLYAAQHTENGESVAEVDQELLSAILSADAAANETPLPMKLGSSLPNTLAVNTRLHELGYLADEPIPTVTEHTMAAAALFCRVAGISDEGLTPQVLSAIQSDAAPACPQELQPDGTAGTSSQTPGQVITDKQLKILRKWLTKSFAVNHTDRQAVKRLQMRLIRLGYLGDGAATMVYDQATADAVMKFQTDNQLTGDGIPTKRTLMMIFALNTAQLTSD